MNSCPHLIRTVLLKGQEQPMPSDYKHLCLGVGYVYIYISCCLTRLLQVGQYLLGIFVKLIATYVSAIPDLFVRYARMLPCDALRRMVFCKLFLSGAPHKLDALASEYVLPCSCGRLWLSCQRLS